MLVSKIGYQISQNSDFDELKNLLLNYTKRAYLVGGSVRDAFLGIKSKDYDIESVYIDGLFDIVTKSVCNAAQLFYSLEDIGEQYNVNFYISINEEKDIPEIIKKYVA